MRLPLYRYSYHQTELMLLFKIMNSEITSFKCYFLFCFDLLELEKSRHLGFSQLQTLLL